VYLNFYCFSFPGPKLYSILLAALALGNLEQVKILLALKQVTAVLSVV